MPARFTHVSERLQVKAPGEAALCCLPPQLSSYAQHKVPASTARYKGGLNKALPEETEAEGAQPPNSPLGWGLQGSFEFR